MAASSVPASGVGGPSQNALGSVYMVVGSLGYVTNDALIRAATEEGLDVYQALCLRGAGMSVLFAAASRVRGERITREQFTHPLALRVAMELVATALFFGAIIHLEFANAQTILLIVPFVVTLMAAFVLGEAVTARQYATVLAGFGGVLFVVQPATDQFSPWSLAVVGAAACLTIREFATRRIADNIPAPLIGFVTAVGVTALTGTIAVFTGWGPVTTKALALLALACLCLIVGYIFTIQTVRVGDLSVSAPFRYTTLLGAVVLGYLLFDEIPDTLTLIGCSVIVLSGLYSIHLERLSAPRTVPRRLRT